MKYRSLRKCVFGKELLPSTLIAVFAATATALPAVSFAESNDDDMEIVTVVARILKNHSKMYRWLSQRSVMTS
jgi:hypothetical protein